MASLQDRKIYHRRDGLASTAERIGTLSTSSTISVSRGISWTRPIGDRSIPYVIDGGERSNETG